jgi:hypothetical protein
MHCNSTVTYPSSPSGQLHRLKGRRWEGRRGGRGHLQREPDGPADGGLSNLYIRPRGAPLLAASRLHPLRAAGRHLSRRENYDQRASLSLASRASGAAGGQPPPSAAPCRKSRGKHRRRRRSSNWLYRCPIRCSHSEA